MESNELEKRPAIRAFKRLAAALTLLFGLALWAYFKPSTFPMDIALKDGSRIQIYELAFRTNVFSEERTVWQSILAKIPRRLQPSQTGLPPMIALQAPSLVLVYSADRTQTNTPGSLLFKWMDDTGFENSGGASTRWSGLRGPRKVIAQTFSVFPRRSKRLRLRIFDSDRQPEPQFLGEVSFPNGWQSPIPPWTAPALPQKAAAGGLSVELAEAAAGARHAPGGGNPLPDPWTLLKLRIMDHNEIETNWGVISATTQDASGNTLVPNYIHGGWEKGVYSFWFRESLWPAEPIRHQLGLIRLANFPSNELWIVPGIPIPAKGGFTPVALSTNLAGQKIKVDGLADAGVTPPWRLDNLWTESMSLHLTMERMTNGSRLKVVSVVDDQGRNCLYHGQRSFDNEFAYGLKFAEGSKHATVTLAVQQNIQVEFTVKPEEPKPDAPGK